MADSRTRIYRVVLERAVGKRPGDIDELLESVALDFFGFADAQRRAKAELVRRSAPLLHSRGVEMWLVRIECGYYEYDQRPLPAMSLGEYYRREDDGRADWAWDSEFDERSYQQKLPVAMRRELEARAAKA